MRLRFLHGWGFDADLWRRVAAALGGRTMAFADAGYFGVPRDPPARGPLLAVGHSLGAMRLLLAPPAGCAGIVAINGFDRFAGGQGVPRRVLDRMIARYRSDPAAVLDEFRARCGAGAAPPGRDDARLLADLRLLRDGDARGLWRGPLLALDGGDDPIVPAALRAASFADAAARRETCADGGHLLPLSHADWCAARIAAFAGALP